MGELAGFSGNSLEEVVDEGVHDAHGLGRYTNIGVNLFQNVVDVDSIGLLSSSLSLLLASASDLSSFLSGAFLALLGNLRGLFAALGRCWC